MMTALENEVLRNPKPSLVDRSVLELSADRLVPPDIYVDRALLRAGMGHDVVFEAGGPSRGNKSPWSESPDSDAELVAEAKARIQELQKEADSLEEAYRNYQQRATYSTISHMLPTHQAYPSQSPSIPLSKHNSQRSHVYSAHKSKTLLKAASPPIPVSYDAQHILPPTHIGDTITEELSQPRAAALTDHSHHFLTESLSSRDGKTPDESSVPHRASRSSSRKKLREQSAEEEEIVSLLVFPLPMSDRKLSCDPLSGEATTGDLSPDLSPPRSPQLKSTTREQSSPPQLQLVMSSSESPPQPEKINLADLTGELSEPSHIPELLLDTAVPLSEEAPDDPAAPHPHDLPGDPTDSHSGQTDVPQASGQSARITEEEEDEERKWERERKERQERRQRELEEAKERERQELQQLEKETLLQEAEEQGEEETVTEVERKENEEQKEETNLNGGEPKEENPLEKYMKMILKAREKQHEQTPVRQESGQMSPEDKSLSDEKDKSVAAFSPKDEEDDFW